MNTHRSVFLAAALLVGGPVIGQVRTSPGTNPVDTALAKGASVDGVRLGGLDVKILGRVRPQGEPIDVEKITDAIASGMSAIKRRADMPTPTEHDLISARKAGFSEKPSVIVRAFLGATDDEQTEAVEADIGIALVQRGDLYEVEGHINLSALAKNGHLSHSLAKAILAMPGIKDVERADVLRLYKESMAVNLGAQWAFFELNNRESKMVSTMKFDSLTGSSITAKVGGFWGSLWQGVQDTVNCYLSALTDFAAAQDEITWSVTCGTSGCEFTLSGTTTGPAASAFMSSLQGCLTG